MKKMKRNLFESEEMFHEAIHLNAFYPVQAVILKGKLLPSTLKEAIKFLLEKYEILQAVIAKKDGILYYRIAEDFKERFMKENFTLIEKTDEKQWETILSKETEEGYQHILKNTKKEGDETGLLVRMYYLYNEKDENSELVLGYHHSALDGLSLTIIINDLLKFANSLMNNEKIEFKLQEILDLPNLEDPQSLGNKGEACGFPTKASKDKETYFTYLKIEKAKMAEILKKCKENQTTFNSLLLSGAYHSLTKYIFTENGKYFSIFSAVQLRNYFNYDKKAVGMLISGSTTVLEVEEKYLTFDSKEFWNKAKVLQQELIKSIDNGKGLAVFKKGINSKPMDVKETPIMYPNIGVTNRGNLDELIQGKHDHFEIFGYYLSLSYRNVGLLTISTSTIQGNAYISIGGAKHLFSKEKLDEFVKYFFDILLNKIFE